MFPESGAGHRVVPCRKKTKGHHPPRGELRGGHAPGRVHNPQQKTRRPVQPRVRPTRVRTTSCRTKSPAHSTESGTHESGNRHVGPHRNGTRCSLKDTTRKSERQVTDWDRRTVRRPPTKDGCRLHKELSKLRIRKQTAQLKGAVTGEQQGCRRAQEKVSDATAHQKMQIKVP